MVSTDCPNVFFRMARFMPSNSAEVGFSSFDATVVLAFFRTGSDLSTDLPGAGPLNLAAVVKLPLEGWPDARISGFMIGGGAFSSAESFSSPGWTDGGFADVAGGAGVAAADGGLAVFAATDVGLAGLVVFGAAVDFTFAVAGLGVNGAGLSSRGESASAVLSKHPREEHPCSDACCGLRQLQPSKVADSKPTRSILI
jgi:hypothetical protein